MFYLLMSGLWGCQAEGTQDFPYPPLRLEVTAPEDGVFLGDAPLIVRGRVTDPAAWVWVEGRRVNVGPDGDFQVELPVGGDFRTVDIEAAGRRGQLREQRLVYAGVDPLQAFPGGIGLRLTEEGLQRVVGDVGALIDATGWDQFLVGLDPTLVIVHAPTEAYLSTTAAGLELDARFWGLRLSTELDLFGLIVPLDFALDEIRLRGGLSLQTDAAGLLTIGLVEPAVTFGELSLEGSTVDLGLADLALQAGVDLLEGIADGLLSFLSLIGPITLEAPLSFELDLLGTPVAFGLGSLGTDASGLYAVATVLIDGAEAPPALPPPPLPDVYQPQVDLVLNLHEGLLQLLAGSDVLGLLEQTLRLEGFLSTFLELPLQAIPGSAVLPETTAWCVTLSPGEEALARMEPGLDPLGRIILPRLRLDLGYDTFEQECTPWLHTELALVLSLVVRDGTALSFELDVADGTVLTYTTTLAWAEDDVVAGLGGLVESLLGLLGTTLEIDLAALGGGALAPEILAVTPQRAAGGGTVPGGVDLHLRIFGP